MCLTGLLPRGIGSAVPSLRWRFVRLDGVTHLRTAPGQHRHDRFYQILGQMEAICHLDGLMSALLGSRGILLTPITRDQAHFRMVNKPGCGCGSGAIWQEIDHAMGLQVDQNCAIGAPPPERKVINARSLNGASRRLGTAMISRSWVVGDTCIPSLGASRAATSPQVASPRNCNAWYRRSVIRAHGRTSVGRRSVKMRGSRWAHRTPSGKR